MNTKTHKVAIAAFLFLIIGTIQMHQALKYIVLGVATIELIIVLTQVYQSFKSHKISKEHNYD